MLKVGMPTFRKSNLGRGAEIEGVGCGRGTPFRMNFDTGYEVQNECSTEKLGIRPRKKVTGINACCSARPAVH